MPVDALKLVAKAGITVVRDDTAWGGVEKERGTFNFARAERYVPELKRLGLAWIPVMAYGNRLYDSQHLRDFQAAPCDPAGYAAYANYCEAVFEHYGSQVKTAEIWNEYNGSFCAGKAATDRPKFYTEMLKVAYEKIKKARPDVQVVGGAMVKIPLPYFKKLCEHGALQYLDGIVVHPYISPEETKRKITQLVALTQKYNRGESKPIWVTECGTWDDHTIERATAAGYLARMFILLLTQPEVAQIDWFLVCDYAEFKNQGLFHSDKDPMGKFTPVALYPAYANLIQQLHHTQFVGQEATDSRTRVYHFQRGSQSIWTCWSDRDTGQLVFSVNGPVRSVDLVGGETELKPVNGKITVTAGNFPVYVVAGNGLITAVAEVPRQDTIIADSAGDFSDEQGKNNWNYLYYLSNLNGSAHYDPGKSEAMRWEPILSDWEERWVGPSQWFGISESGGHPAVIKRNQAWAIRRWTSDRSSPVHIIANAKVGKESADGVGINIYHDDKELFAKLLRPGASVDIDLTTTVAKGAALDFAITPGPGINTVSDNTGFRIMILTQVQSP